MSLELLLSEQTMTVYGPNPTKDTSGGYKHASRPTVYSGVPCRAWPKGSALIEAYGQLVMESPYTVYTEQSGIGNGMVLKLDDGTWLRVRGVDFHRGIGTMSDQYAISCVQLEGGA